MSESSRPQRRTVLKGAAWSAPAIVLATAAPAMAASGEASVITTIPPAEDTSQGSGQDGILPVVIDFTNNNTGATGAVTVRVLFQAAVAGVESDVPTEVSPEWTFVGPVTGNQFNRAFTFTSATGIPGATSPTGTATASLRFTVRTVTAITTSSGVITTTATAVGSGAVADGAGVWS